MRRSTVSIALVACLLGACAPRQDASPTPVEAPEPAAGAPSDLVRAEALPGRRVRLWISAHEPSLSIDNCNRHIVVTLVEDRSGDAVWGGESDACLSPPIIVPERATLSFVVAPGEGGASLSPDAAYRVRVVGVSARESEASLRALTNAEATSQPLRMVP